MGNRAKHIVRLNLSYKNMRSTPEGADLFFIVTLFLQFYSVSVCS